jgi:excisionase family DNA binding protein
VQFFAFENAFQGNLWIGFVISRTTNIRFMNIERIAYTVREASEITGLPENTLRNEIRQKRLIARRAGKAYYIHRDRLDEYLKCPDQESQPASISAPTMVLGSSVMVARIPEQDWSAKAQERKQKRRSVGI